jgi:ABC-type Na+ efflux pump permease subunit
VVNVADSFSGREALFGFLKGSLHREEGREDTLLHLLFPGLVGLVSLFGASSVVAISIEKQTETYELLQTAPVSTATIVLGRQCVHPPTPTLKPYD